MLGHKLMQVLGATPSLEVHGTVRSLPSEEFRSPGVEYHAGVDLAGGTASVARVLDAVAPDVIVNAIGAIKQRDLYSDIDRTYFLNGSLPHLLSHLNPNRDGRTIHFSTDCVYTGSRGSYLETEAPDATDVYGRSKAIGELTYAPHLTIRTSIIGFELSAHLGLVGWLMRQTRGSTIHGYTEAIFSGLPTVELSRTVRDLIVTPSQFTGVWHVASQPISKFDLLTRINAALDLGLDIQPSSSVRIDRSLLDVRFRSATGTTTPGWDELTASLRADFVSWPYAGLYDAVRPS
jgi:dTDP-4-dehydrorhamnose reductase